MEKMTLPERVAALDPGTTKSDAEVEGLINIRDINLGGLKVRLSDIEQVKVDNPELQQNFELAKLAGNEKALALDTDLKSETVIYRDKVKFDAMVITLPIDQEYKDAFTELPTTQLKTSFAEQDGYGNVRHSDVAKARA